MAQSSNVYAVAMMGDGRVLFAQKDIKVTLGGCGGCAETRHGRLDTHPCPGRWRQGHGACADEPRDGKRPAQGRRWQAHSRLVHPAGNGAKLNGKTVLTAQWGPAVSKNPFLQFTVKGAKAGDRVSISWLDNRGDKRSDEAVVG